MSNINVNKLSLMVGRELDLFESARLNTHRQLTYTSFDGDDMLLIPDMEKDVLRRGMIPVNPESALGYYISTESREGKKSEVMKDCITLEFLSDSFSLYTNYNIHVPEGVLIEIALWNKRRGPERFDVIPAIGDYDGVPHFTPQQSYRIKRDEVLNEASSFVAKYKDDVYESFFSPDADTQICRKTEYTVFDRRHFKYSDWLRKFVYDRGHTPVSPTHLLKDSIYRDVFGPTFLREMLSDRYAFLSKVDNITIFNINADNFYEEFAISDLFYKFDVYMALKYYPTKVTFASMADAHVPKFIGTWSLTKKERTEVQHYKGDTDDSKKSRRVS